MLLTSKPATSSSAKTSRKYYLAPGSILQNMYLETRLKKLKKAGLKTFLEVGAGNGKMSEIFLKCGFSGDAYDLSDAGCEMNAMLNSHWIDAGKFRVHHADFFEASPEKVDLIFSSHTIEHFSDDLFAKYFEKCGKLLNPEGRLISIVPAGKKYWGIEDETVGHYRRFEFGDFEQIARRFGFQLRHVSGLTFPISNLFLGLSNRIVERHDGWKRELSKEGQTRLSSPGGTRNIPWKSEFPHWVRFCVNKLTLFPFYLLQRAFCRSHRNMVLYSELTLPSSFPARYK